MGNNKNSHFNKTWERLQRQAPRRLLLELRLLPPLVIKLIAASATAALPVWPQGADQSTERVRCRAESPTGISDLSFCPIKGEIVGASLFATAQTSQKCWNIV